MTKLCLFWIALFCALPAIAEQSASTNVIAVIGGTTIKTIQIGNETTGAGAIFRRPIQLRGAA